jgi:hypothetical protein
LKPGDLCKLIGTRGWGDVCVVIKLNANGAGGVEILRQDGKASVIGRSFLDVIDS